MVKGTGYVRFVTTCHYISIEDYEEIKRNVVARHLVGDSDAGDRVLAKLLTDNEYYYHAAKARHAE